MPANQRLIVIGHLPVNDLVAAIKLFLCSVTLSLDRVPCPKTISASICKTLVISDVPRQWGYQDSEWSLVPEFMS